MRDHRRTYGDQVWRLEDDAADRIADDDEVHIRADGTCSADLPAAPKCGTCGGERFVYPGNDGECIACQIAAYDAIEATGEGAFCNEHQPVPCPDCGADAGKESKR